MRTPTLLALVLLASALCTRAATVALEWDASPSPEANGYKVYQGFISRTYTTNYPVIGLTYQVQNLTVGSNYFFTATATATNGLESDFCNEISYMVPPAPVIVTQPASATNTIGGTQSFTVLVTGGSLGYQWFKDGTALADTNNVSGATTVTLTLAMLTGAERGSYSVRASNTSGSVTSAAAFLSIIPPAPTNFKMELILEAEPH